MNYTMKEIPESQRPYEKCVREGESVLSDGELLAVILRCGTRGANSLALANEILNYMEQTSYPGLLGLLHSSVSELKKIHGIGTVKAVQLKCIGELSKRIAGTAAKASLDFHSPDSIAAYYMERLRHQEQELMICMMLDNQNHLLGDSVISKGTVNATLITPREVYLEALRYHAVNLILIHNHPGGNPAPSRCDTEITERVRQAGEMLGICLLDHIIIGDHRYISFREEGLLEKEPEECPE
ncbi:RadC family protein [Blautia sp. MSJ-19]|uniref:RadC family protein n=1 Tax=Blautia sp. MSJ-19 TaxID=2841517 RepID=UPI001C0EF35B|nr:DNA repair protein RadC [Blautia sp. MSJ-19]MBU5481502.1 DNA repair protein RadC [Blautia sp. MSJ-19]